MDADEGLGTHHLFRKLLQQLHFLRYRLQRLLLHLLLHLAGALARQYLHYCTSQLLLLRQRPQRLLLLLLLHLAGATLGLSVFVLLY